MAYDYVEFSDLLGKVVDRVSGFWVGSEVITISCKDGTEYFLEHDQCCCESVSVEDIVGDANDLIGQTIEMAEEISSNSCLHDPFEPKSEYSDRTWTYYKLATTRGCVTLRWYGVSNGYYSTNVSLKKLKTS